MQRTTSRLRSLGVAGGIVGAMFAGFAMAQDAPQVPLDVARQAIARDWHEAYRRYVRPRLP